MTANDIKFEDGYLLAGIDSIAEARRRDLVHRFRCGHTTPIAVHSRYNYDRYHAVRLRDLVCPECQARTDQAAEQAAEMGLPALVGTPKQVAWAETIRAHYIETGGEAFLGENSAKWWIENRWDVSSGSSFDRENEEVTA